MLCQVYSLTESNVDSTTIQLEVTVHSFSIYWIWPQKEKRLRLTIYHLLAGIRLFTEVCDCSESAKFTKQPLVNLYKCTTPLHSIALAADNPQYMINNDMQNHYKHQTRPPSPLACSTLPQSRQTQSHQAFESSPPTASRVSYNSDAES